jgi:hypothetical protein
VDAILSLLRHAIADRYDYCVLITGSCYPLRTGGYIRTSLNANRGLEYMDILKVPGPGKPLSRYTTIRYPSTKPIRRFTFRTLGKIGLAQRDHRKHLRGLELYSGDGAWALTREACQFVLDFISVNPHVERYFRRTFAPDEAFFHSILGNSKFRERMRRNLIYAVWPGSANGHPAMITAAHVAEFEQQDQVRRDDMYGPGELLFARKFNDQRMDVVTRVDAMIEGKEDVRLPSPNQVWSLHRSSRETVGPRENLPGPPAIARRPGMGRI